MTDRLANHPTPRLPWEPAQGAGALDRQTKAAEYIAMYLDRIEIHLDRIASELEKGTASGGRIAQSLHSMATTLPRLLGSR